MKKIILLLLLTGLSGSILAQKIGYIDSGFILNKMPEYKEAQAEVERLSQKWQSELDQKYQDIEKFYQEYKSEEVLLTEPMKKIRLDSLEQKRVKLAETQKKYFGFEGLLFLKRQEIVKPIQDKMFEAVEKVCRTKRIDIMFDKASDLVMLYTNPVHDYTEYILEELDLAVDNADYSQNTSQSDTTETEDSTDNTK
ncbi:MAG TPA: OmpH family outer membrane protein [Cytophagales bacterium]|nr:OmpH family outer membrane protein [Cytophagales bacterium]